MHISRKSLVCVAAVIVLTLVVLGFVAHGDVRVRQPSTTTLAPTYAQSTPSQAIGINHAYADPATMVRISRLVGFPGPDHGWVRLTPEWRADGNYGPHQAEVTNAHTAGLKVLTTGLGDFQGLQGRLNTHSLPVTLGERNAYQAYVAIVAQGSDAFEVWNEPNSLIFGGDPADGNVTATPANASALTVYAAAGLNQIGFTGPRLSAGLQNYGDLNYPKPPTSPYYQWEPQNFFNAEKAANSWFVPSFNTLNSHAYAWSNGNNINDVDPRYNAAKQLVNEWSDLHAVGITYPIAWSEYGAPSASDTSVACNGSSIATQTTQRTSFEKAHLYWQNLAAYGIPEWGKLAHTDVDDPTDFHCGTRRNMGIDGRLAAATFATEAARVH